MRPRFALDADDPIPLYAQLERAIKLAAITGSLKIGDRLPTVRQMAVDLRINANTVAKVYAELERQGVLSTRRGVGTFIEALPTASASLSKSKRADELRSLAERFLAEGASKGFTLEELLQQIQSLASFTKEKSHGRSGLR